MKFIKFFLGSFLLLSGASCISNLISNIYASQIQDTETSATFKSQPALVDVVVRPNSSSIIVNPNIDPNTKLIKLAISLCSIPVNDALCKASGVVLVDAGKQVYPRLSPTGSIISPSIIFTDNPYEIKHYEKTEKVKWTQK